MFLSNRKILSAMREGRFVMDPVPTGRITRDGHWQSPLDNGAIQATLDCIFYVPMPGRKVDPDSQPIKQILRENFDAVSVTSEDGFILKPGQFVLAQTAERVHLPRESVLSMFGKALLKGPGNNWLSRAMLKFFGKPVLMAQVEGKSSYGRLGITVHITAPIVHNGTDNKITLEILNASPFDVVLRPGVFICQFILVEMRGQPDAYESQYSGQTLPCGSLR